MAAVTMRDVAKLARVSEATVSLVVNGHTRRVSEDTRSRVLAAINELRYSPNTIARSLVNKTTWTIGLIVTDVTRSPYTTAIKGVESVAMRFGYNVILCNAEDNQERLVRATEVLAAKHVDGVIYVLSSRHDQPLPLEYLTRRNIPVVLVNRNVDTHDVPAILIDNTSGTNQLTQQLIAMGHKRIGCIHLPVSGSRAILAAQERLSGYKNALTASNIPFDAELCREGALGEELGEGVGYRMASSLLSIADRPTALVCCNDFLAIGAIKACEAQGLSVPHDMAVVGHDNISAGRYISPSLTTVDQPMLAAGEQATQLLVQMMWEKTNHSRTEVDIAPHSDGLSPSAPTTFRLPCTLVIRHSSGHLPA